MKQILSMITPLLMVGLHMLTGWDAILILLGAVFVFGSIILAAGVCLVKEKFKEKFIMEPTPRAQLIISTLNCTMYLVYFMYINSYILTGLFTLLLVLASTFKYTCTK